MPYIFCKELVLEQGNCLSGKQQYHPLWQNKLVLVFLILLTLLLSCQKQSPTIAMPTAAPLAISTSTVFPAEAEKAATPFAASTESPVTISFGCYSWQRTEYGKLATAFHKSNPNIQVQIVSLEDVIQPAENMTHEAMTRRVVSAADTAWWPVTPEVTRRGLTLDLTSFVDADPTFGQNDFYPSMLSAFSWDGGLWAVPFEAELLLLFYDKDAFEATGAAYPYPGWDLEEFLTTVQQLTQREGDSTARYGFVDVVNGKEAFIRSQAGSLLDTSTDPATPALDTPVVTEAVRWYTDLALKYEVMPNPCHLASPPAGDRFFSALRQLVNDGRAAMWTDFGSNRRTKGEIYNLGIAPFPHGKEEATTPMFVDGYIISAGTAHPHESWRWLTFLSRQRIRGPNGEFLDRVPARFSVAEEAFYWARMDKEAADVYHWVLEHALAGPQEEGWSPLSEAITNIFEGETVEEAVAQAQATAIENLVAHQEEVAQVTPQAIRVVTPVPVGEKDIIAFSPAGSNMEAYRELAAVFNQEHPGTYVRIVASNQADMADCFAGTKSLAYDSVRTELLDLQPLIESDASFSVEDFFPHFVEAFHWGGRLWGIPTHAQAKVVFYNKALFDQSGVSYPALDWTLDDFLNKAIKLTLGEDTTKQYGYLPLNGYGGDLPLFFALQSVSLWNEQDYSPLPCLDAPGIVTALRWYADLALVHGVMPVFPLKVAHSDPDDQRVRETLVREGRVAMWTDFTGAGHPDTLPEGFEYGIVPMPRGSEQGTQFIYKGLYISRDTPHVEACWAWLKFASQRLGVVQGLPARRTVAYSSEFEQQVGRETAETYRTTLEYADLSGFELDGELSQAWYWLGQAFADILAGARPKDALAEAQQKLEDSLSK